MLKGLFTQTSLATAKRQTCELGAEELVMSEIQGTYNCETTEWCIECE